jgi:hypothetical protein
VDSIASDLTPTGPDNVAALSKSEWQEPIYIPEAARKTRLTNFPLSVSTLFFLNYNDFWVAGNLHGRSFLEIRMRRWCDLGTIAEVHRLVRSLQEAHGLSASKIRELRQSEQNSVNYLRDQARWRRRAVTRCKTDRVRLPPVVTVPENVRRLPLFDLALPVRLEHILHRRGVHCLGDLDAVPVENLLGMRDCGVKTVASLLHLIERAATADEHSPSPLYFSVTENVRHLNPFDLPLSVRLEGILQRRGVHCLGDLHATRVKELQRLGQCGVRSISELKRLIGRAAAGEFFTPPADAVWEPAELVQTIDALMAALPDRNREILALRLGAENDRKQTYSALAARFDLTTESVRQVVLLSVRRIRKSGSLPLRWHLEQLDARCRAAGCPLSSDLLGQWLPSANCHFPLAFYVRLIGCLHPDIKTKKAEGK